MSGLIFRPLVQPLTRLALRLMLVLIGQNILLVMTLMRMLLTMMSAGVVYLTLLEINYLYQLHILQGQAIKHLIMVLMFIVRQVMVGLMTIQ